MDRQRQPLLNRFCLCVAGYCTEMWLEQQKSNISWLQVKHMPWSSPPCGRHTKLGRSARPQQSSLACLRHCLTSQRLYGLRWASGVTVGAMSRCKRPKDDGRSTDYGRRLLELSSSVEDAIQPESQKADAPSSTPIFMVLSFLLCRYGEQWDSPTLGFPTALHLFV